jgi:arylsulfatase
MAQRVTSRVSSSEPQFVGYPKPKTGAPNVVMVVLDDVGFAQLGCFGGGIDTPNIDRLAAGGLRYNRFHVTSVCSSTRACLLTGRNHHAVGMGLTQESVLGFPGYTGRIPKSAATLARTLRDAGYNTMAVGKWHLTARGEYSAAGPFERWPLGLGFEKYYGFLGAETSQWAPELVRDNTHVDPPSSPEEGYHLTEDLVDEALRVLQDQRQATQGAKPSFLYFAPGAAHAPHQVAEEWIEPYRGRFDDGWERGGTGPTPASSPRGSSRPAPPSRPARAGCRSGRRCRPTSAGSTPGTWRCSPASSPTPTTTWAGCSTPSTTTRSCCCCPTTGRRPRVASPAR